MGRYIKRYSSWDLSLINLECVVSSVGKEWDKTFKVFHFRAHPEAINVLKVAGIDYVSLANYHVLDYDNEALIEMLDLLDKNEIRHSGAGRILKEAMEPAILNTNKRTKPKSVSNEQLKIIMSRVLVWLKLA